MYVVVYMSCAGEEDVSQGVSLRTPRQGNTTTCPTIAACAGFHIYFCCGGDFLEHLSYVKQAVFKAHP